VATTIYRERRLGAVNWLGFWTLYVKEVRRFMKVYTQTLAAPIVTTLLYLVVFLLALGNGGRSVGGVSYGAFLAPGLIMMTMAQNAFANTSSSIIIGKVQGNIVDILMPPLSAGELALAIILGGATRGLAVGAVLLPVMMLSIGLEVQHWGAVLYFGATASLMLSSLGVIGGLWSEKFDHIAAVTNFIVVPLSFLSGTFYSVARLPPGWQVVAHLDPFFYMIDGFRFGFIDHADAGVAFGAAVMAILNIVLLAWCWRLFAIGYKIRS
jgi:ABC-2 type transport system permease protein